VDKSQVRVRSFTRSLLLPACGTAALLVAGCATTDEGPYRWSEGWRQARVERLVQGAGIENPRFWRCTRHTAVEERSKNVYALLSYRDMHHKRHRMVPISDGLAVGPGDNVYANISRCADSLVPVAAVGR
jgi:hypothetical protein